MPERRELYRSPNGDCWFLGREPQDGLAFVIHQANGPSGAHLSHIELGAFLNAETKGPEHHARLRLSRLASAKLAPPNRRGSRLVCRCGARGLPLLDLIGEPLESCGQAKKPLPYF